MDNSQIDEDFYGQIDKGLDCCSKANDSHELEKIFWLALATNSKIIEIKKNLLKFGF